MIDFIPATMARSIGDGVFFRPIRSWHSATYAGEGLTKIPGSDDSSGCLRDGMCPQPRSVTHRAYWHKRNPKATVSVFLSYPNAMGACDQYFWEMYPGPDGDVERFIGDDAEAKMEEFVKAYFKELVQ